MKDPVLILKLLELVAKYDCHSSLFWHTSLEFYINCNDAFYWACSDVERINEEDMGDLEKAFQDGGDDGALLYCARCRKMRPQGAAYDYIDKKNWTLFNVCGPGT